VICVVTKQLRCFISIFALFNDGYWLLYHQYTVQTLILQVEAVLNLNLILHFSALIEKQQNLSNNAKDGDAVAQLNCYGIGKFLHNIL